MITNDRTVHFLKKSLESLFGEAILTKTLNNNHLVNDKACLLTFILRGSNRRTVYQLLLSGSRTIAGISAVTGIPLSNVSRVIKDFKKYGLVENLTPSYSRGCFYQLTSLALKFKPEFEKHTKFRVGK
jgi:hypothetical protein